MPRVFSIEAGLNWLAGPFVTIFTLHRPAPQSGAYGGADEDLLRRCLDYATKKNYLFKSIDQLVEDALAGHEVSAPTICFTLDDGYADQVNRLLPLLIEYETAPSLFVITDFIDQKMWPWDAKLTYLFWNTPLQSCTILLGEEKVQLDLSSKEKRIKARRQVINTVKTLNPENLLNCIEQIAKEFQLTLPHETPIEFASATWQDLRDIESKGVRIGSHTKNHIVLNSTPNDLVLRELHESRQKLHHELSQPSNVFCYPLGTPKDFSLHHTSLVESAGYSAAISTNSNLTNLSKIRERPFQIQRIALPNDFEKFIRYTSWREAIRSKLPF